MMNEVEELVWQWYVNQGTANCTILPPGLEMLMWQYYILNVLLSFQVLVDGMERWSVNAFSAIPFL